MCSPPGGDLMCSQERKEKIDKIRSHHVSLNLQPDALTEASGRLICSVHADRTSRASRFSNHDKAAAVCGTWHPETSKAVWGGNVKPEGCQRSEASVHLVPQQVWERPPAHKSGKPPKKDFGWKPRRMSTAPPWQSQQIGGSSITLSCSPTGGEYNRANMVAFFSSEVLQKNSLTATKWDQSQLNVFALHFPEVFNKTVYN